MKIYRARTWGMVSIHPDLGPPYPLNPRFDLKCVSVTGLAWGYVGRGPQQLAIALIADATGDAAAALARYEDFALEVLAPMSREGHFEMTEFTVREKLNVVAR